MCNSTAFGAGTRKKTRQELGNNKFVSGTVAAKHLQKKKDGPSLSPYGREQQAKRNQYGSTPPSTGQGSGLQIR